MTSAGAARVSVHVVLMRKSRVVDTQAVPGGTVYRFVVTPGSYVVSSNAQYIRPVPFSVRSGEVDHVDLTPLCK
jgi:hypothetical protein